MRYRLVKPDWAVERGLEGPRIIEGDYSKEFLEAKNQEGYNVYFFPNFNSKEASGRWLKGSDVDVFRQVFVDMDLKDGIYASKDEFMSVVADFEITPNRIVDSGNGIHVYWNVADLARETYVELQFRLINHFKTDASIWTVLQLMRVPGTLNTKRENNFIRSQILLDNPGVNYVKDFRPVLPALTEKQEQNLKNHCARIDGLGDFIDLSDAAEAANPPQFFLDLLETNDMGPKLKALWEAPHGKRSEADWALANALFTMNYSAKDAVAVLLHTSKAREKGNYRKDYARNTVAKAYLARTSHYVTPLSDLESMRGTNEEVDQDLRVSGPVYFDCTEAGWKRGEVLGMIAGSGVGKTTATLDIFYEILKNNPEPICVFFSLEMQDHEILERWINIAGKGNELTKRLFVVTNEDAKGMDRHINLQKIYWYAEEISKIHGPIAAVAIDHIGIVDTSIDISKEPTFGIKGEDIGFGTTRTMAFDALCSKIKELAKKLQCFIIVQSQTTKAKAEDGDIELGVGAAFGTAKFEWYVDYIMTFWQPLRKVEHECPLRVLGWQYCKIRNKRSNDRIKVYDKRIIHVDLNTGKLRPVTEAEFAEFQVWEKKAAIRRVEDKKKSVVDYKNAETGFRRLLSLVEKTAHSV